MNSHSRSWGSAQYSSMFRDVCSVVDQLPAGMVLALAVTYKHIAERGVPRDHR